MVLQNFGSIEPLLKHQWPTMKVVELHWRDTAVFVSLSSRTNTQPRFLRALMALHDPRNVQGL
jgi:hypothetical protein